MENVKGFFNREDKFAQYCGMKISEVRAGYAKGEMAIQNHHLNGAGTVHGGAIFTLADYVFAAASNSHGQLSLAINASISFFKAESGGVFYAEAKEISITPKLATYAIEVTNENGDMIAIFNGTVYRKRHKLEF